MSGDIGRRALLQATGAGAGLLAALAFVRAAGKPMLKAGDQKGGLRALLECADELKNLPYEIEWAEFPAAAPLAEALNAEAVELGPIGDAPLIFALAQGVRIKAFAVNRSDAYGTAVLVKADSPIRTGADLKGKQKTADVYLDAGLLAKRLVVSETFVSV